MANTAGAKAVVIGIATLGVVTALAVLWMLSLVVCFFFGWSPVSP